LSRAFEQKNGQQKEKNVELFIVGKSPEEYIDIRGCGSNPLLFFFEFFHAQVLSQPHFRFGEREIENGRLSNAESKKDARGGGLC
jgi:hypothetical protein